MNDRASLLQTHPADQVCSRSGEDENFPQLGKPSFLDPSPSFAPARQYLDPRGHITSPLPAFCDSKTLVSMYRGMVIGRMFDAKAVALQRTGRLGTLASSLGQEGSAIGVASAMRAEDVLLPDHRSNPALLWRGVKMEELLLYWGGDERGSNYSSVPEDFPICLTLGLHATHAVGVACAFKLRGEARVAVCVFGDGAMSKGDVWEAMNFAGVVRLPVVFVVVNNHWATSIPTRFQTATPTLAEKAAAVGFLGERVDGNDVIAVRASVEDALAVARLGQGPRLIEAVTYRLDDHTTSDNALLYRSMDEVESHRSNEPLGRLRAYLMAGGWTADQDADLVSECQRQLDAAVAQYLSVPAAQPQAIFDHLHERLPSSLERQRSALALDGRV